jgi:RNA polymerase sigma-70 factor, ECF subfamily
MMIEVIATQATEFGLIDATAVKFDNTETMNDHSASITDLLQAAASGERDDVNALMGAIYDDLHRLAAKHLRSERADHTLQPTALVHEAYLKLIDQKQTSWRDRNHFFAIAARVIRRILVDHARGKGAVKRGAGKERIPLEHIEATEPGDSLDLVALDEALEELNDLDARQAKIVEMRFFGGMSLDEIAETLDIGRRSVDRHWSAAKAWLLFRLSDQRPGTPDVTNSNGDRAASDG